jgi:Alpha-1,3-glucanase catalytic domain D1/Alpha-1,3-glucanase catalytic domain D2
MKIVGARCAFLLALASGLHPALARMGADTPWTTYEAEDMRTTGTVLGPKYGPFLVEMESSGQKCVKLRAAGQYLEFTVGAPANAMVVRYSLPDAPNGGGLDSELGLYLNGAFVKTLPLTSRYSWLYGKYPFSNNPRDGRPRNFYDECRSPGLNLRAGDVVRLEKTDARAPYCIVDLVDLEQVPPPLAAPAGSLTLAAFGASGRGESDDTEALRQCIAAAVKARRTVWVAPGLYKLSGDIDLPAGTVIQGAGMWHTTFAGMPQLYTRPGRRLRFKLNGSGIRLADFAIIGALNYRNDAEPNDGVLGTHCDHSTMARLWVEHTKAGMWFYSSSGVVVEGCRFRNTVADGLNFCAGVRGSVVWNCTARGTGDDCFAIWPAPPDRSSVPGVPGDNVIRRCTGQLPFLANGAAIYGGAANRIEDCLFTDISPGCGILLSTTFPTATEHNFGGTTVIRHCELRRCGGYDHEWGWRAALQFCLDRRAISGVTVTNVTIKDSFSDGLSVIAPGGKNGQGTLSNARLDHVVIPNCGLGAASRHELWVRGDASGSLTLSHSRIVDIQNSSTNFTILRE